MGRLLLALGASMVCGAAAADIYKWVDADGGINYADEPPPGIPSERLVFEPSDSTQPRSATARQAQPPFAPNGADTSDQAAFEPVKPAGAPPEGEARPASTGRCLQARMRIAMLEEPLPVYRDTAGRLRAEWRYDTYRGERQYISDLTRAEEIARMRQTVAESCEHPDDAVEQVLARKRWMMSEYCAKLGAELDAAERAAPRQPPEELAQRRRTVGRYCAG